MFSLNPSAGPTRQSPCFSSFSRNRRPHTRPFAAPPPPLTRRLLATPRRRRARSSPLRRRPRATPSLLRCCSAVARAPAPCLRHLCAADHQAAAIQVLRRRLQRQHALSNTRAASPAPISLPRSSIQDRFDPSTLCLGALKVFEELTLRLFFAFFPVLQGYGLYTLLQSEIPLIHHPFAHMFTYILALITHTRILSLIFAHAHIDNLLNLLACLRY